MLDLLTQPTDVPAGIIYPLALIGAAWCGKQAARFIRYLPVLIFGKKQL